MGLIGVAGLPVAGWLLAAPFGGNLQVFAVVTGLLIWSSAAGLASIVAGAQALRAEVAGRGWGWVNVILGALLLGAGLGLLGLFFSWGCLDPANCAPREV